MKNVQKWILVFLLGVLSFICLTPSIKAEDRARDLQSLINEAQAGATIILAQGIYEGPVIIDKPLQLEARSGEEVTITNNSDKPAIQINADDVALTRITIRDEQIKKQPTVLIQADGVLLDQLQIHTGSFGIKMRKANHGEVRNSSIVWAGVVSNRPLKLSDKGNGMDLYESNGNTFYGNTVIAMHDGIYMENSDNNLVEENHFERLRYGVHCMYTKGTIIRNNIGRLNITGAMVMAARKVELSNNQFTKQSENVNSQGILLFDAHEIMIFDNHVEGNRVGLYVEQSTHNRITNNSIVGNFIGLQLLDAENNTMSGNQFIGNVASATSRNSANNTLDGNYWDTFQGIDLDGDGKSEISYAINPFFQSLVKAKPGFQLFFQSPGMVFLEGLYQSQREQWAVDASPLMKPTENVRFVISKHTLQHSATIGGLLLCLSIYLIYLGVRRK
ncbi:nitrous oxidase accessory protein [Paenibacillus algorifonticola]|uniref:Nitrous oxidase accessory protein n=1 Tax=Paenibacillus algorifonticola TaxID=684063 RepID=A0A1I1YXH2_9BACL|nr:NosD domain-containing protein [Paenibacillus algorifonticola]SFE24171.1 nitrous oxidase accessory protein [Paenibacillus algorifonticola]